MPKQRVETVVSDSAVLDKFLRDEKLSEIPKGFEVLTFVITERDEKKDVFYMRPTLAVFPDYIAGLSPTPPAEGEESPLLRAWRDYITSLSRRAAAEAYEGLVAESTIITMGRDKRDLMDTKPKNLIVAINGYRGNRAARLGMMDLPEDASPEMRAEAEKIVDKSINFGPWRTAAKKLCEGYKKDGKDVAPVARENAATGMLELIETPAEANAQEEVSIDNEE